MSSDRKWTHDQQNAIDARGGLVVSAAAGSGKTAVLVERVVKMISDEDAPTQADRLLIATFSNAAAKELRERISGRLSELIASGGGAFLRRQQNLLAKAHIGTIDSFCSNLLRENANLLDFDGDFRIADEAELESISEEALDCVLQKAYDNSDNDFTALADMLSSGDDRPLQNIIKDIYKFIRSFPFPKQWLEDKLSEYQNADIDNAEWKSVLTENASDRLEYNADRLESLADEVRETELEEYYYDFLLSEAQYTRILARKIKTADWDDICGTANTVSFSRIPSVKKGAVSDLDFKEHIQKERKAISTDKTGGSTAAVLSRGFYETKDEYAADLEYLYPSIKRLFALVTDYYDVFDRFKKEKGVMDYSDLELNAIELLAQKTDGGYTPSALAKRMSLEFDEILLDEYQDTNALQDMIFTLLSKNGNNENEFAVGDVKQSIYGFRKAMPEIFMRRRDSACAFDGENYPALINLSANFRSRHSVTDYINFVFSRIMSKSAGDIEYNSNEKLYSHREFPEYENDCAELHILDVEGLGKARRPLAEPEYVAETIAEMIDSGYLVESKNGLMRPCRESDFCILMRSLKNAGKYASALKKRGLTAACESSGGYFEKSEVAVFINLLRIINNPLDDIAMLSVLMSPAFGFTPDEVVYLRGDKKQSLYAAVLQSAEQNPHAGQFIAMISELRSIAACVSVTDTVREILSRTDLVAAAGAMRGGVQRQANIRGLLDYAVRYEKTGRRGLAGFVSFLERLSRRSDKIKCVNALNDNSNAVRIMTIHGSKGLEFPICIVSECSKKFNTDDQKGDFLLNRRLGVAAKVINPARLAKYPTAFYTAVKTAVENDNLSEEMRVLYVALTRAKEKLITVCKINGRDELNRLCRVRQDKKLPVGAVKSAKSYSHWLIAATLSHPGAEVLRASAQYDGDILFTDGRLNVKIHRPCGESGNVCRDETKRALADAQLVKKIAAQIKYEYPHKTAAGYLTKLAVTQLAEKTDRAKINIKARPRFLEKGGLTPAERGTIAHKFLQFADYKNAADNLDAEIERLYREEFLADYEINALNKQNLLAFFASPLLKRILSADEVYREYGFFDELSVRDIYPEADEADTVLVQGIADCVISEGGKITVIDYKTDYVKDENELVERYSRQLTIYANALKKSFEVGECSAVIYSLHLKRQINLI